MALAGSKPLASLSSGLLARKGEARPAMRPQAAGHPAPLDDLGWNDMGQGVAAPASAGSLPPVLVERRALAATVAPTVPEIGDAKMTGATGRKAAFTLRLDAERHLRLRLASATTRRSAQALLVQALDRLLATLPDVETLAAGLPVREVTR